ncbi:response regulator transcription factor [Nocardioides sp. LHD-245]|uniref:response regulator transcription factor n=1 Tax=Nocardioides sp. LHD-245 TaxID=3051387 RepID=UPI0027DF54D1|nr:response regulator transcription factor [Nocardioides sp. LHD-245]
MQDATTVLVADDDEDIAGLMRDYLEAGGYRVSVAHDGLTALDAVGPHLSCVLLDVDMPGLTGFEVLRRIRETSDVPVLLLTALGEDRDKLRGLGLGADDYIVKSASPAEVVARVHAVLRRSRRSATDDPGEELLDYGRLVIDVHAHEVRIDGAAQPFTAREFELLEHLARHPRRIITREQLFDRFWGEYGDRHTLTVHISRVREKIEEDPARPRHIVTVRGVGYRFEGERVTATARGDDG